MKRITLILVFLFIFISNVAVISIAQDTITFNTFGTHSVGASIDYQCNQIKTTFTIAPGMSATNFQINHFIPGYNCYTSDPLHELGFIITDSETGVIFFDSKIISDIKGVDSIALMSGLVLGPGTYMIYIHTGGKYASVVLEFTVGPMGTGTITTPTPGSGVSSPSGNLISNGDFSKGISGWTTAEAGYSSNSLPYSTGTYKPNASRGYLDIGVYGGYFSVYQDVPVKSINNLLFSFKMKAHRWSTYNGGMNGGMMRVWIAFMDNGGNQLGSASFYLNPMNTYTSKPTEYWEQVGSATPTPTDWYNIEVDIHNLISKHLNAVDTTRIASIRIGAGIFGTHEDGTYTVGHFDDFFLGY